MTLLERLLAQVQENARRARPLDIRIGQHWTVLTVELAGQIRGGLSSTLGSSSDHHHGGRVPVRDAGKLLDYSAPELLALAHSDSLPEASVGLAMLNALLDVDESRCVEVNAAEVIAERGAGRNVTIVGHFPFTPRIRRVAGQLWVLEKNPRAGDTPASRAHEVIPQSDVVAITGTTLLNHTFDALLSLCRPEAYVLMLGGTTPLSEIPLSLGVDAVAGTLLADPQAALLAAAQGATYPQIPGKRLLTIFKPQHAQTARI